MYSLLSPAPPAVPGSRGPAWRFLPTPWSPAVPCQGQETCLYVWLYPLVSADPSSKQRPGKPCSRCEVRTLAAPDTLHGLCNSAELGCSFCKCFSSLIAIRNKVQFTYISTRAGLARIECASCSQCASCCDPSPSLSGPGPPCSGGGAVGSSEAMPARARVPTCCQLPTHSEGPGQHKRRGRVSGCSRQPEEMDGNCRHAPPPALSAASRRQPGQVSALGEPSRCR